MKDKFTRLRVFNLIMGFLHLVQGIVMVIFSNDFQLTITTAYLKWNERLGFPITNIDKDFFMFKAGPAIAGFLFLSAFFHFLIASPGVFSIYKRGLEKHINKFRWIEYAISSSLMVVVIAMLSGMFDFSSLILIFALNGMMNLFGYMMELHNQTTQKTDWTAFIFGCLAGIVPWVVIALYFYNAILSSGEAVPKFVYFILVSLFINFNIFPINMVLQYLKVGPWKNYLFGETVYIILSLVAKSLLAWQVFGGTLR